MSADDEKRLAQTAKQGAERAQRGQEKVEAHARASRERAVKVREQAEARAETAGKSVEARQRAAAGISPPVSRGPGLALPKRAPTEAERFLAAALQGRKLPGV